MKLLSASFAATALFALPAQAALELSKAPTGNMVCAGSVCTATAEDAVLNVADLATMLATGDVRVDTKDLQDIVVAAPVAWSSSHALTIHSDGTIVIRDIIGVQGKARLNLDVASGPLFKNQGAVKFANSASRLTIGGKRYKLVGSIADLAAAVAARPHGRYALADDYDAKTDGIYKAVPVKGEFHGIFEGLGNRIANFQMNNTLYVPSGLFETVAGTLRNFGMTNINIYAEDHFGNTGGGMVATNSGTLLRCYVDGGRIRDDYSATLGGLAGQNNGRIVESWANVDIEGAETGQFGGLVGNAGGRIENSYAMGNVAAGDGVDVGGLIGVSSADVRTAYAAAEVFGAHGARVGGFAGTAQVAVHRAYWDTEISGTTIGIGSGQTQNVIGLTTAEFQSGLPKGFRPDVWGRDMQINGGLPYLLANPPRN